jgi:hypothetical protein
MAFSGTGLRVSVQTPVIVAGGVGTVVVVDPLGKVAVDAVGIEASVVDVVVVVDSPMKACGPQAARTKTNPTMSVTLRRMTIPPVCTGFSVPTRGHGAATSG